MKRIILAIFLVVGLARSLLAAPNDPGGGKPGQGSDVTIKEEARTAVLSNGRITAVVEKANAKVLSMKFDGTEMVDPAKNIYYSMDGGANFDGPWGCTFSVRSATPAMVDVACRRPWDPSSGRPHALDFEIHYVLRKGDTGLYTYALLDHPAAYPALEFGEWRMVWWLPHEGNDWTFERVHVDAARHWDWGTYGDFRSAAKTEIGEVVRLTSGRRANQFDCKYQYAAEYHSIGTWGHTGVRSRKGAWIVLGGYDFLNGGPTQRDLTLAESYNLVHLGRNHFGGPGTRVAKGEDWRKCYGPILLYANSTPGPGEPWRALWADAQAQVAAEMGAWPYDWMSHPAYPGASARGAAVGRFVVKDALKPALGADRAWIGLAADESGAEGNWQSQAKGYQTWTRADADGRFSLRGVRPGEYTLYAFVTGAVGEFSRARVKVEAGGRVDLGDLTWIVPRAPGERLLWEIGVPDRTAGEFFHGKDAWNAFLWKTYCTELPNPIDFVVGKSDPARHWNYAHGGHLHDGQWSAWPWRIHFQMPSVPASGEAVLTLAFAGSEAAHLNVFVNDERKSLTLVRPPNDGGNALMRQGNHATYGLTRLKIPLQKLKAGENVITLVEGRFQGPSSHVMYDYLSLALVPTP